MTRIEQRLLIQSGFIGAVLTIVVVLVDAFGWIAPLERLLHDRRARDCQFFTPPPTDKLIHLDIDDRTLDAVGRWPWPRRKLAAIIDEISRAGAKAVALDILFPEPQNEEEDKRFADAVARCGRVLIPMSLDEPPPDTPIMRGLIEILADDFELDLERDKAALLEALKARGFDEATINREVNANRFIIARREAMRHRLEEEMKVGTKDLPALRRKLLPQMDDAVTGSPQLRLLENQRAKLESLDLLSRFGRPMEADLPEVLPRAASFPPISRLSRATAMTGFVDYLQDSDGVIRSIPLWFEYAGRIYPQLSLALACMMLDVDPKELRITSDHVTIPLGDGRETRIPIRSKYQHDMDGHVGMVTDVPWFGPTTHWEQMYEAYRPEESESNPGERGWRSPVGEVNNQHIALVKVWDLHDMRQKIASNSRQADEAVKAIYSLSRDVGRLAYFKEHPIPVEDVESRMQLMKEAVESGEFLQSQIDELSPAEIGALVEEDVESQRQEQLRTLESVRKLTTEESAKFLAGLTGPERNRIEFLLSPSGPEKELQAYRDRRQNDFEVLHPTVDALRVIHAELPALVEDLEQLERELSVLKDRAVLIGYTAVGTVDFWSTSLHAKCPGVVVHGVIFNAILTDHMLWHAPHRVTLIVTLLIGILGTVIAAVFSPIRALLATLMLGSIYWVINGIVLYDYTNTVVGIAGPMVVVVLVWSGCTLYKFVVERRERTRITRRFSSYVDPALVNYVIENPDQARLDGQVRELTVVFTDLQGFTALSEKLQENTVPLLNEYMGRMVPIIREHNGYVNKFLGDGMMFFFGAPRDNQIHAADAVNSVLKMQDMMTPFNESLVADGLPTVRMRVGVSSGVMVVGDAGSADASDYTVLGDAVNLGARLESANKATGTRIMINQRTAELIGDLFLLRPIGRLRVVGKEEDVMVYEPLSKVKECTDEQRRIVALSRAVVETYLKGEFAACLTAIEAMEAELGPQKLTGLYRDQCEQYIANPPENGFDGNIVLTEK